jgi:ubiquitin conjugation factor E4 B
VVANNLLGVLESDSLSVLLSDVETTGSSSEFYDKFTIRYHISLILKGMWDSPVHRQAIINESRLLTCLNILGILSEQCC